MGQRLGIAAALLGDPAVLMFDEPVNGLDPEGIVWVRHLMRALAAEGRTVFVSSHLMSEMALTADHLIVIGRGQLIRDEGVNEFVESSSSRRVTVRSPQTADLAARLQAAGAVVEVGTDGDLRFRAWTPPASASWPRRTGSCCMSCGPQRASLEEAFMELTSDSVEFHAKEAVA